MRCHITQGLVPGWVGLTKDGLRFGGVWVCTYKYVRFTWFKYFGFRVNFISTEALTTEPCFLVALGLVVSENMLSHPDTYAVSGFTLRRSDTAEVAAQFADVEGRQGSQVPQAGFVFCSRFRVYRTFTYTIQAPETCILHICRS